MSFTGYNSTGYSELAAEIRTRKSRLLDILNSFPEVENAISDSWKGADATAYKDELNKVNNLFLIGRNGQHRYNNMDHSILTGLLAADEIISGNIDKEVIWKVNTEEEYAEEKKCANN